MGPPHAQGFMGVTSTMDRRKFGLGFLKGRADSFRRGLLTIAHVEGAANMAARYGVADHDIAAMLIVYGLAWDGRRRAVTTSETPL